MVFPRLGVLLGAKTCLQSALAQGVWCRWLLAAGLGGHDMKLERSLDGHTSLSQQDTLAGDKEAQQSHCGSLRYQQMFQRDNKYTT